MLVFSRNGAEYRETVSSVCSVRSFLCTVFHISSLERQPSVPASSFIRRMGVMLAGRGSRLLTHT